jgi:hypothetical protein
MTENKRILEKYNPEQKEFTKEEFLKFLALNQSELVIGSIRV